jgi:ATP-binding protein involved in chromosome partitioning
MMRIAIPVSNGILAQHFGHCERFALVDVDSATKSIQTATEVEAPEHQPGLLPRWLKQRGVTLVIAGNMGSRALSLFTRASIEVLTGAEPGTANAIADMYLAGTLKTGANTCDH